MTQTAKVEKVVKGYEGWTVEKRAALIKQHGSKSEAIRQLEKAGVTRGDISVLMGVRYQHVRNVCITPVKTAGKGHAEPARVGTEADLTAGMGEMKAAKK